MSGQSLTEPNVLRSAKNSLLSEVVTDYGYFVTDTQFSTDSWLDGEPISTEVTEDLAPFNHVRIGSGYPDLVGAGRLSDQFYRGEDDRSDSPPLIVVEAKGFGSSDDIDPETGVIQAHDRLQEANMALVAVPEKAVSDQTLSLSRELNVGLLGVDANGTTTVLEKPRIVGTHVGREAAAIRHQAGPRGVAHQSFGLNRPKNYLGYPLCVYHSRPTAEVLSEYVVSDCANARDGAAFLNLIDKHPDCSDTLTSLGQEVVRFGLRKHEDLASVLTEFAGWKNRRKRLSELAPDWALMARWIVSSYPATQLITNSIQELQRQGETPTLPALVSYVYENSPAFAVEFFIRDTAEARGAVISRDGDLIGGSLEQAEVYRSWTTYQFKQILYHTGIVTEPGSDSSNLEPVDDFWTLEQPL